MPGGIAWKLGRRDKGRRERLFPYVFGLLDGWFYNAARERTARQADADAEPGASSAAPRSD